jgi:hypothetical protein
MAGMSLESKQRPGNASVEGKVTGGAHPTNDVSFSPPTKRETERLECLECPERPEINGKGYAECATH